MNPAPPAGEHRGPGLYLHVPFCSAICPYCDFSVLTGGAAVREDFVRSLLAEMALWSDLELPPFDTLYFGGGTPSALAPEQLRRLLDGVRQHLAVTADAWIFLEANPEDVSPAALAAWRQLGVRTLSLGVQSFQPAALAFLGRRHSGEQAEQSVRQALAAGFDTVSLDLIYGLPGQQPDAWRRDLAAALALAPQHLSCYQLTVHQGTPFGFRRQRGQLAELPADDQAELFLLTHQQLGDAGLDGYEVSNFAAAPHHRSRHNRKYWDHTPYLGLGPSAHSYAGDRRWWNERKLKPWRARLAGGHRPVAGEDRLDPEQLALEALMLGLRTRDGIDLATFRARYGADLAADNAALLDDLEGQGLLRRDGPWLRPSLAGLAVADALAGRFQLLVRSSQPADQRGVVSSNLPR